ncbi:MAG TPA: S9 family peptidase [Capsulimonadaceae bacterium]|nr:S9 family peptidase [Capsulimonadaceae bacterium]
MPRPISAEDFMAARIVSDPQIAPDGTRAICVVRRTDKEKNKSFSDLWIVPAQGGKARRFTSGNWNDSSPRWSPDSARIAFLSDRDKPKNQIYLIDPAGGEAEPLTKIDIEGSLQSLRWSPDGRQIAFLFRATPEEWRKDTVEERKKKEMPSPVRVHTRLTFRLDGFGYWDDSYWQVWVADEETGEAKQLTFGDYNCGVPVWSPDSKTLAFIADPRANRDIDPGKPDIWTIPAQGGELSRVPAPEAPKRSLAWSPDGQTFAYVGPPDPKARTANARIYVIPATGSETALDLTGDLDQTVGYDCLSDLHDPGAGDSIIWSADSKRLYFPLSAFGDTRLHMIDAKGGQPRALTPIKAELGGFSVAPDGRSLVITLGTLESPHEVFFGTIGNAGEAELTQRTHVNEAWLQELEVLPTEGLSIPSDVVTVQGWLIRPVGFDSAKKYPLVLYVHGGPHLQYGNTFFHELQFLAANGYVVLYTNPRGSTGYGEAFTGAIKGDWGGADFADILAAADYAEKLPFVDPKRIAIMGGSYGGFMTAWAIGHTGRFACAIADRLVANQHSMAGTSDFPWRNDDYFKGNAWDSPEDLWRCSPLKYMGNVSTPLLLIHSDGDLRCPVAQSEEIFTALRLQRKTAEFVRYPGETSHGMSRGGPPNLRVDRLQRNLAWLNRWLKPGSYS